MGIQHFGLFVLATFFLNITPGNDFIYVATRSLNLGVKAGIVSAFGISAGLLFHVSASVLGFSAFLARSVIAFEIVRLAGAGYLMYLGIRMFFTPSKGLLRMDTSARNSVTSLMMFRQGLITNLFNPKVALFFLSFLPQFADPRSPNFLLQLLLLGLWFIISGTIVSIVIALLFGRMRKWLASVPMFWKWQQKVTSFILVGLGLKIAFEKHQ